MGEYTAPAPVGEYIAAPALATEHTAAAAVGEYIAAAVSDWLTVSLSNHIFKRCLQVFLLTRCVRCCSHCGPEQSFVPIS